MPYYIHRGNAISFSAEVFHTYFREPPAQLAQRRRIIAVAVRPASEAFWDHR